MSRVSPRRTHASVLATATTTAMMRSLVGGGFFVWLFWLSSLSMLSFVHGYASWLPCFIDLDESEVVMNHHIRPATDSDYLVQIEAKLNDDPDWTTSSIEYPADQISVVSLRLKVPPELERETRSPCRRFTPQSLAAAKKCGGGRFASHFLGVVVVVVVWRTVSFGGPFLGEHASHWNPPPLAK